jgi:hypothetical protein
MASIIAAATVSAVWSWGRCNKMVNRVLRSTKVPIALRSPAPRIRSPLPVTGHGAIGGLGGTVADGEDLPRGIHPGAPGMATRFARRSLRGQAVVQIGAQTATGLHIQALVDGFVAHLHQLVIGVIPGQYLRDQLRAPPVIHPVFDSPTPRVVDELKHLGPASFPRCAGMRHPGVIIPVGVAVALNLAIHDGAVTSNLGADLGTTQTSVSAPHDRDAFIQIDPMTAPTRRRQHTGVGQPATPTLQ